MRANACEGSRLYFACRWETTMWNRKAKRVRIGLNKEGFTTGEPCHSIYAQLNIRIER